MQNTITLYMFVSFFHLTKYDKIAKYLRVMISRCSGVKARLLILVKKGFVICNKWPKVSFFIEEILHIEKISQYHHTLIHGKGVQNLHT